MPIFLCSKWLWIYWRSDWYLNDKKERYTADLQFIRGGDYNYYATPNPIMAKLYYNPDEDVCFVLFYGDGEPKESIGNNKNDDSFGWYERDDDRFSFPVFTK